MQIRVSLCSLGVVLSACASAQRYVPPNIGHSGRFATVPGYTENDQMVHSEHALVVRRAGAAIDVDRTSAGCDVARLGGDSWLLAGSATRTTWKDPAKPVENIMRFSITWARRAK